jgi:hypothetical protein
MVIQWISCIVATITLSDEIQHVDMCANISDDQYFSLAAAVNQYQLKLLLLDRWMHHACMHACMYKTAAFACLHIVVVLRLRYFHISILISNLHMQACR